MKTVVIRCRKCWVDIAVQKENVPVPKCPSHPTEDTTYQHGYVPKGVRLQDLVTKKAANAKR